MTPSESEDPNARERGRRTGLRPTSGPGRAADGAGPASDAARLGADDVRLITAGFALDKLTAALHQARVLTGTNWVETGHLSGLILTVAAAASLGITRCLDRHWRVTVEYLFTRADGPAGDGSLHTIQSRLQLRF